MKAEALSPKPDAASSEPAGLMQRLKTAIRHRIGYGGKPPIVIDACRRSALKLMRRSASFALFEKPKQREIEPMRSLFVAPHMDDEAIGAGGTIELLRRERSEMALVFTANCAGTGPDPVNNTQQAMIRDREASQAAAAMEMEYLGHLDFRTGALSRYERAMGKALAKSIRNWQPETIFVPYPTDGHRDHQATSAALAIAIKRSGWKGEVWCYEVWSPMFPNTAVDISAVVDAKREFIACYPSQLEDVDYTGGGLGLNRLRGESLGVEHAEAFYVTNAGGYCDLVRQLIS